MNENLIEVIREALYDAKNDLITKKSENEEKDFYRGMIEGISLAERVIAKCREQITS